MAAESLRRSDRARAVGVCFATPTADSVAASNTKVAGRSPPRDLRCLHQGRCRVYAEEFVRQQLCGDGHTETLCIRCGGCLDALSPSLDARPGHLAVEVSKGAGTKNCAQVPQFGARCKSCGGDSVAPRPMRHDLIAAVSQT